MSRSQYVAVFVGLLAVGGLVAVNLQGSDPAEVIAAAGDQSGDGAASTTPGAAGADATPEQTPEQTTTTSSPIDAPPVLGVAGDLVGLDGWLNTEASSFADFDGSVRVVQFWTFGCINCKNTLGNLRTLHDQFAPRGLEVIGVHAPEFDYEADPANIAQAAADLGVTWPIALDTDKTNFRAWQPGRRFWPRTFVLDREGNIRFDRIGEGAYDELNATVAFLVENPGA